MAKIRIISAIASKHGITLYLEDGQEKNLPTTSWRTKAVLDDVLARLARKEIVEIDLDSYSIEARVAEKTGGVLRFVRKTKSAVAALFGKKSETETGEAVVVSPADPVAAPAPAISTASAVPTVGPAPTPEVSQPPKEEETELVAVVTDMKSGEETVIPGVVALERHIEHAVMTDNVKGLQRFMERIASVSAKRSHTVQELLRFMERGDLPIADDGSIVAYKVLRTKNANNRDLFVDCHTGRVEQRVGSMVMQDEKLIDQNRRNECSTGLHIARRGYLSGFSGNVITIVKVAPEDVVAVPDYDANKMRASGYHIVGRLPDDVHATLRSNQPMTGNAKAAAILADVIAGNHVAILERVRITSASGGSFTIEKVSDEEAILEGQNGFASALDAPIEGLTPKDIRAAVETARSEPSVFDSAPVELATKDSRDAINEAITQTNAAIAEVEEELEEELEEDEEEEEEDDVIEQAPASAPEPVKVAEPVETKAERDARRKREKRAAAKLEAAQEARRTPPSKLPIPEPTKSVKSSFQKAKLEGRSAAPAESAPKAQSERDQKALEMVAAGRSLREVEKELKICRKRLGKLVRGN